MAQLISSAEPGIVTIGSRTTVNGWKLEQNSVYVYNGSQVAIPDYSVVFSGDVKSTNSGKVFASGHKPEDLRISHRTVPSVFRGIQIEKSSLTVSAGQTIMLTGYAIGGIIQDVGVPYKIFTESLAVGSCFVKGKITEIPEISLDSSIKLGVKLYTCDNKLLNVLSYTSAYFTFDDELQLNANIDPVNNIIFVLAKPQDLAILKRKKIYDMSLHVVDTAGNPSIVLTRKLRFI